MLGKALGAGGAAVVLVGALICAAVVGILAGLGHLPDPFGSAPSADATADIPPDKLALYRRAARACPGLDWSILAGIGKVETDHGRSPLPGVATGENFAGAGGPMQFLAPTFDAVIARHRIPPGGATPPSRHNPHDATYAAAHYLCDSGAPGDLHRAIFAYNHADWYVRQVLDQAKRYAAAIPPGDVRHCPVPVRPASRAAAIAIEFACRQLGQPYVWGGDGPAEGGWDCSGLVKAAYQAAGITLPRVAQDQHHAGPPIPEKDLRPGDLVFYGTASNVHHVGMYLGAGKMINAPTFGIPVEIGNHRYPGDDYFGATRPVNRD